MAEQTLNINYIIDPFEQFMNLNGKPLVGGYITLYLAGTNEKYISYQNFDFTQNPFKVPINADGRVTILVDVSQSYDAYVYSSNGNLVVSRLNLSCAGGAGGGGLREVIHDNTLTGKGTQLTPLGVSPLISLAVDETLTAYESTVSGQDALVLGVNGDWFNNQMASAFDGKVDTSAFEECCSAVNVALDNKADIDDLSDYYTKNETYNNFLPRSAYLNSGDYYEKSETYNRLEIESLVSGKQSELIFGYDSDSAISSINNSAIGGQGASYPASAEDAVQYVVNNSATINEVNNTYESNSGSYITAHQPISSNQWNSNFNTVNSNSAKWNNITVYQNNSANYFTTGAANTISSMLSGAIDYVSANIGQVISGDYELSAGYGVTLTDFPADNITRIDLTASTTFPITGTNGTASFTADMNSSAIYLSTAQGVAGLTTKFTGKGVQYQAYPSTDVSASWYNIIKGANISSLKLTTAQASYTFTTDEIRHLSQINVATPYTYSGPSTYSVTLGTKTFSNLDSGCYYDFMRAEVEGTESWVIGPTGAYSLL